GWYHTGDRGYFRDGYLFFTGRATEMIKTAGNNVSPREVEVALEAFPEIRLALVFGVPDDERGQVVVAGVAPTLGATIDVDDVRERVRKELSSYKVPRAIVVLADDEIPWLGSGKAGRRPIAATVAAQPNRQSGGVRLRRAPPCRGRTDCPAKRVGAGRSAAEARRRRLSYRPLQTGARFSTNATEASRWSSLTNVAPSMSRP